MKIMQHFELIEPIEPSEQLTPNTKQQTINIFHEHPPTFQTHQTHRYGCRWCVD